MRNSHFICVGLLLSGLLAGIGRAETFQLNDQEILSGDVVSFDGNGLVVRQPDDTYSDRVPWTKFSQADLKKLAKNPKIAPFVEPFIEVSRAEKLKKTEVDIKPVARLDRPPARSLLGALASSSVGLAVLLLLYAANFYAAYEISLYRAQPVALVCGVSALVPVVGPVIFLSLPTRRRRLEEDETQGDTIVEPPSYAVSAAPAAAPASAPGRRSLRLAQVEAAQSTGPLPTAQVFQRGAFTFNRRFFETKFPGFFGVIRRDADKDMVLFIKAARGEFIGQRISRIAANELHIQVQAGQASEEVMIPFSEIQEVRLQHKDA
jgi:hypothetical protein